MQLNITQIWKITPLTIGSWNIRNLLDNPNADRPERRTAFIDCENARYSIDIASLSETRFTDEGQLTKTGDSYTYFWSGRSEADRRESAVGFTVKTSLVKQLSRNQ